VGEYARALAFQDRVRAPRTPGDEPRLVPAGARPLPAVDAIAREARATRAVFINEAHEVPQHRAFSIELLRALRAEGFTVFAAEMIAPEDTALLRRGYPAMGKTGIYTDEPLAGELVREALRLGFRVIAYDPRIPCDPRQSDPAACANERERVQAERLARVLADDPSARLVVHAGLAHIYEEAGDDWTPMAVRFREMSGVDPLTVDQTLMSERSARAYERPLYRDAAARGLLRGPTVFRQADGSWLVDGAAVDIQVFHPRTRRVRGRPQWMPAGRRRVSIPVPAHEGTVLLQAFHAGEGPDAVPADQVLAEPGAAVPALALDPGDYRVAILGEHGPVSPERQIRVDARGRVHVVAPAR
jgi:hypothetical protein